MPKLCNWIEATLAEKDKIAKIVEFNGKNDQSMWKINEKLYAKLEQWISLKMSACFLKKPIQ